MKTKQQCTNWSYFQKEHKLQGDEERLKTYHKFQMSAKLEKKNWYTDSWASRIGDDDGEFWCLYYKRNERLTVREGV